MVPVHQLVPLVNEGKLSPWALISRYEHRDVLFHSGARPPTGIPVLDTIARSSGWYNYNFRDIPVVDRFYTRDGLRIMWEFPEYYARGLAIANRLYFSPTSMNRIFDPRNRNAAYPMDVVFNPLLYGAHAKPQALLQPHFGDTQGYLIEVNFSISLALAWFAVIAFACVQAWKGVRGTEPAGKPRAIVMGFIAGTALYLYVLSTAIELAENYRYRFLIEPLMFVLASVALTALLRLLRSKRALARNQKKPRPNIEPLDSRVVSPGRAIGSR
jgi:hypothetical protein